MPYLKENFLSRIKGKFYLESTPFQFSEILKAFLELKAVEKTYTCNSKNSDVLYNKQKLI